MIMTGEVGTGGTAVVMHHRDRDHGGLVAEVWRARRRSPPVHDPEGFSVVVMEDPDIEIMGVVPVRQGAAAQPGAVLAGRG